MTEATSIEAYINSEPLRLSVAEQVEQFLYDAERKTPKGLTQLELFHVFQRHGYEYNMYSITPRCAELELKGIIRKSAKVRVCDGNKGQVWRWVPLHKRADARRKALDIHIRQARADKRSAIAREKKFKAMKMTEATWATQ